MSSTNDSLRVAPASAGHDVLEDLVRILETMIAEEWDAEVPDRLARETRLAADLAFTSIDLVALLTDIEDLYQRRDWPFEELLMVNGRYVEDVTLGEIADFLLRHGARR